MPLYISTKVYLKSPHSLTDLLPCLRLALFETGETYSKRIYIWSHTGCFFFDLSSEVIFLLFSRHLCSFFILTSSCCFIISLALCRCRRTELDVQKLWHISVSPLSQGQLLLLNSTKRCVAIYVHACVCVCVCVDVSRREIDRVANRWTGRLVVCLSSFKTHQTSPFCDYTVYLQVWKKKERKKKKWEGVSLLLSESVCCLSMWRESHVPCRAFQACLLTWWLPWEQPDSGRLCTSLLGGIVRTERRFKSEESLRVFKKKKASGKNLQTFCFFLMLKALNSTGVWCFWRFQQTCFNSGFNKDLCSIFFFLLFVQAIKF